MIAEIIQKFQCGEPEVGNFRYCGKEVRQDSDFNITITCKDTTLKMEPIRVSGSRKATQALNDQERTQMKSVAGSLSWIARNCRPDIAYGVSKVQSLAASGQVKDIKVASKLVKYAVSTAERDDI